MSTLLKPLLIREELLRQHLTVFAIRDFTRLFRVSRSRAQYFLEQKSEKDGLFFRLKKGLYALKTDRPREEVIANRLYQPSYISFEYALAYHNIIPEMVYEITSATTKPTRTFEVGDLAYSYSTIKTVAYTGYSLVKRGPETFFMAEPEKALVDYLYFVALGKRTLNDRLDTAGLDKKQIIKYAKLYKRDKLMQLVKELP